MATRFYFKSMSFGIETTHFCIQWKPINLNQLWLSENILSRLCSNYQPCIDPDLYLMVLGQGLSFVLYIKKKDYNDLLPQLPPHQVIHQNKLTVNFMNTKFQQSSLKTVPVAALTM